jgi:hypothetical protein
MNLAVDLVFYLLVLAGALAGLIMAAHLVVNVPLVGAALCLAPAIWIYGGGWDVTVAEVASFSVYASDLVAVVLIVAALMQLDAFGDWAWPLAGITALLGLSLLQGLMFFGEAAAINEARSSLYLMAAVWWAVTVDWTKQDTGKAALVAGWCFVALALIHLSLYGFRTVNSTLDGVSEDASLRMLNANQALILALCAATVIFDRNRRRDAVMLASAAVFTLVVIAAQNRSVWIALLGGFLAVFLLSPNPVRRRRALGPLVLGGLVAVLVLSGSIEGAIGTRLNTAATATVTWDWRVQSWQQLLSPWLNSSSLSIAFGEPFGQGLARVINNRTISVSAHSWYVEMPLRIGVIGLLLWLKLIVLGMAHARKVNTAALFYGAAFLCFSVAYVLPWHIAPWLGILLTVKDSQRHSRNVTPPRSAAVMLRHHCPDRDPPRYQHTYGGRRSGVAMNSQPTSPDGSAS